MLCRCRSVYAPLRIWTTFTHYPHSHRRTYHHSPHHTSPRTTWACAWRPVGRCVPPPTLTYVMLRWCDGCRCARSYVSLPHTYATRLPHTCHHIHLHFRPFPLPLFWSRPHTSHRICALLPTPRIDIMVKWWVRRYRGGHGGTVLAFLVNDVWGSTT